MKSRKHYEISSPICSFACILMAEILDDNFQEFIYDEYNKLCFKQELQKEHTWTPDALLALPLVTLAVLPIVFRFGVVTFPAAPLFTFPAIR